MKALLEGLRALGPMRLAAMGVVAAGLIALLSALILRGVGGGGQMALLYGDLDLRESGQIVDQLNRRHVPYRLLAGGAQVLIPAEQIADMRLALAKDGLPSGGSIGYELFDRGDSLAFTEFQQKINETRALEGEIARTIRAMRGIRQARVHLVLPRREPFARDRQDAQASVLLTMAGAQRLDREGIQAVVNLVAAAVPGLKPQNIAIVDARGDLLARAGQPTGPAAQALSTEEIRHATELRLARAVEDMLERNLGPGRVRAEASVRMTFDRLNETQESYDPNGQVTRSSQTVTSNSKTTEQNGTVSVQNNLPNADAGTQPSGTQEGRQEETTNYEIGKTVRTLIREQPQIERISLAVMVDGTETAGPDGQKTWAPLGEAELARITTLVKSSIGFDDKRGDRVDVVSLRFVAPDTGTPDPGTLLGIRLEKPDLLNLMQTAVIGLIGMLALLLVVRPMVNRIATLTPAATIGELAQSGSAAVSGGGTAALNGPSGNLLLPAPPEDSEMVDVAQIEGQMRASSLRKLSDMVEKHPAASLNIIRGWLAHDNG